MVALLYSPLGGTPSGGARTLTRVASPSSVIPGANIGLPSTLTSSPNSVHRTNSRAERQEKALQRGEGTQEKALQMPFLTMIPLV